MVEVQHYFDSDHGLDCDEQHCEFHLTSCVIKINNHNMLYDGIKDKKDMIKAEKIIMRRQRFIETRNKSDSITATPGWKMKQPREEWIELLQGTSQLDDSRRPQQSYRYKEANNEMF